MPKKTEQQKQRSLDIISREVSVCKECRLYKFAKHGVPGEGNPGARIFFIGEAPGATEDKTGRPFVGRAGKFLDSLLESIGLKREDVFIGNIVKHRPPQNRPPKPDEVEICTQYLNRQLKIIKPEIIITLGQSSTKYIFSRVNIEFKTMSEERGRIHVVHIFDMEIKIIPVFHPAAALYSPKFKEILIKDFKMIKKEVKIKARG